MTRKKRRNAGGPIKVLVMAPELAKAVRRGAKVSHRIKPTRRHMRPEVGDSLPVQALAGGRRETLCRVEVLDVERGQLADITDAEVKAEGYDDRGAFFAWWRETVEGIAVPASTAEPYGIEVWVVRFQVDQRRFLSAHPHLTDADQESDEAHGYTANPGASLSDEGQVIDPVGPRWNQKLELDRKVKWAEERDTIQAAIDRLMEDPHMRSEIAGELRVLQRRLQAIDARLYGLAA